MSSKPPAWSVLLVHDQLQDARVWSRVEGSVAAFASVRTLLSVPPIHTLGPPAAWADHVRHYSRAAILPDTVDLAVTIGGAGEAGISLVSEGIARAALLLNPDPKVIVSDATASGDDVSSRLLRAPDVAEKLARFFRTLHPDVIEELTTRGTLPQEGVESLVAATLETDEHLPHEDRELLRRIATEQLTATLPLDLEAQQRGTSPERPDWVTVLAPVADRCVIAVTAGPLNDQLGATLTRRVPGVRVIHLASSSSGWLFAPHEVITLIRDLLQRTAAGPSDR